MKRDDFDGQWKCRPSTRVGHDRPKAGINLRLIVSGPRGDIGRAASPDLDRPYPIILASVA